MLHFLPDLSDREHLDIFSLFIEALTAFLHHHHLTVHLPCVLPTSSMSQLCTILKRGTGKDD